MIPSLQTLLLVSLLTPSTNHHVLLRYSKTILDLDGPQAYLDVLRQCVVRQIMHFVELIRDLRDRFCTDASDAYSKAQELSMMTKSAFYSASDRETIAAALRKYTYASRPKRASTTKRAPAADEGEDDSLLLRPEGAADEFDLRDALGDLAADGYDEEDDDEGSQSGWLDFEESVYGDDAGGTDGGTGRWERESMNGESSMPQRPKDSEADSALVLSSHVRRHYLEGCVDTIAKWFPCLLRWVAASCM